MSLGCSQPDTSYARSDPLPTARTGLGFHTCTVGDDGQLHAIGDGGNQMRVDVHLPHSMAIAADPKCIGAVGGHGAALDSEQKGISPGRTRSQPGHGIADVLPGGEISGVSKHLVLHCRLQQLCCVGLNNRSSPILS
eukprot:gene8350-biopygen14626